VGREARDIVDGMRGALPEQGVATTSFNFLLCNPSHTCKAGGTVEASIVHTAVQVGPGKSEFEDAHEGPGIRGNGDIARQAALPFLASFSPCASRRNLQPY
jgi:hypothetical protein